MIVKSFVKLFSLFFYFKLMDICLVVLKTTITPLTPVDKSHITSFAVIYDCV